MRRARGFELTLLALAGVSIAGCPLVLGLDDLRGPDGGASASAGGGGATGSTSGSTGGGGTGGVPELGKTLASKAYGDIAAQSVNDVAIGVNGHLYLVGAFDGPVDFGCGALTGDHPTGYLVELEANGTCVRSYSFFTTTAATAAALTAVAVDADGNVTVAGTFTGTVSIAAGPQLTAQGGQDVFVASYSATKTAELRWSRWIRGSGEEIIHQIALSATTVYAVGSFTGSFEVTDGGPTLNTFAGRDAFVLPFLAATGVVPGSGMRQLASTGEDDALGVAVSATGDVAVVGSATATLNFGNGAMAAGGGDAFVAVYSSALTLSSGQFYGEATAAQAARAAVFEPNSGDLFVAGTFEKSIDFAGPSGSLTSLGTGANIFVTRLQLSSMGGLAVSLSTLGSANQRVAGLGLDPLNGDVVFAGVITDKVNLHGQILDVSAEEHIYAAKVSPDLQSLRWLNHYGNADGHPDLRAMRVAASRSTFLAGAFKGTIDFGKGALTSAAAATDDAFLVELGP